MPQKDRVIFHVDCNNFYASVEEVLYPQYRQVPMAVCGNPESRRGVILAKNELAKQYRVKTAETVYQALQKCSELVLRPARHPLYREFCQRANGIYADYSDLLERASIDESYLDVTGTLHLFGGDGEKMAHDIRQRVNREIGLTVSVGVSYNKVFAKMASDLKKPNAVTVVTRENYRQVLWPLPVGSLLMVGQATESVLRSMNLHTVGDLARADERALHHRLGKLGEQLYINANGMDTSAVSGIDDPADVQSIGNGITFKRNLVSRQDIRTAVTALADSVSTRLRKQGMKCMTLQVTIKDPNFKVITRQKGLSTATWLAADLVAAAIELIEASWRTGNPIRLLALTATKLLPDHEAAEQLSLFQSREESGQRQKQEQLELAMDKIRSKYGDGSISTAGVAYNDLGINEEYGKEDGIDEKHLG